MAVDLSMPVLVVDDYNTMIRIIRNLLKQIGFQDIDDAADGSAALARMREKRYGLVISDWNMEPMTGYELLKEVRADPGLSKTPFIMVTAESKTENVIAAKKAGVNNYIVKPFNAQTLQSKIEAVFPVLFADFNTRLKTPGGFHLNNGVKTDGGAGLLLFGGEAFGWRPWTTSTAQGDGEARIGDLLSRTGTLEIPASSFAVLDLLSAFVDRAAGNGWAAGVFWSFVGAVIAVVGYFWVQAALVETVKSREYDGYAYDGAEASFELLARRELGGIPEYFRVARFRVMDDRRWNARGELVTESEATITLEVGEERLMTVATGNGPVNALDSALRKALLAFYPELEDMRLVDYKVRILTPSAGTGAVTRVMIESADGTGERWSTVGVSPNIIDASFNALHDGISWKLYRAGAPVRSGAPKGAARKP